jgi:hypothetical protein
MQRLIAPSEDEVGVVVVLLPLVQTPVAHSAHREPAYAPEQQQP